MQNMLLLALLEVPFKYFSLELPSQNFSVELPSKNFVRSTLIIISRNISMVQIRNELTNYVISLDYCSILNSRSYWLTAFTYFLHKTTYHVAATVSVFLTRSFVGEWLLMLLWFLILLKPGFKP